MRSIATDLERSSKRADTNECECSDRDSNPGYRLSSTVFRDVHSAEAECIRRVRFNEHAERFLRSQATDWSPKRPVVHCSDRRAAGSAAFASEILQKGF